MQNIFILIGGEGNNVTVMVFLHLHHVQGYLDLSGFLPPFTIYVGSCASCGTSLHGFDDLSLTLKGRTVSMAQVPLIVAIDEQAVVCKIIEMTLLREGYEVKTFPDGVEALRWLTSPDGGVPALILLDVELPKLNGYEVVMRLKRLPRLAETVVILMSRRDGVVDRLKGRLAGCKEYLPKPFTVQALVQVVTQFLGPSPMLSQEK